MTGYAVVSSYRLHLLTYVSLDWITPSDPIYPCTTRFINNCLPRRLSIVLRTRTIRFKADHFSRGIISYVSWGIRLHEGDRSTRSDWSGRSNLNTLYRKGDHVIWGIGYFVTPAVYLFTPGFFDFGPLSFCRKAWGATKQFL